MPAQLEARPHVPVDAVLVGRVYLNVLDLPVLDLVRGAGREQVLHALGRAVSVVLLHHRAVVELAEVHVVHGDAGLEQVAEERHDIVGALHRGGQRVVAGHAPDDLGVEDL